MPQFPLAALPVGPPLLLLLLLVLYAFHALALQTGETAEGVSAWAAAADSQEHCGFDGNSDAYGLGVRLGLYFHWATICLVYGFIREEVGTIRAVNNTITLATFSGLILLTAKKDTSLYAVEGLLMLGFSAVGIFCTDFPPWFQMVTARPFGRWREERIDPPLVTGFGWAGWTVQELLSGLIRTYSMWFLHTKMSDLPQSPCRIYVLYLGRHGLDPWLYSSGWVVYVLENVLYAALIESLGATSVNEVRTEDPGRLVRIRNLDTSDAGEGNENKISRFVFYGNCIRTGMLVSYAFTAEWMIRANHIRGVNRMDSVGQLVAFIVGIGGLLRVVYKITFRLFK